MSKTRGNVVNPDTVIESHGTDSLRLYLMFLGPLEAMKPWNLRGIEGVHSFLQKVWSDCVGEDGRAHPKVAEGVQDSAELLKLLHETLRKVGEDIESLRFNTAISQMMIFENALHKEAKVSRSSVLSFIQVLAPFAPHFAEEIWSRLGAPGHAASTPWPKFDPARLTAAEVRLVFQVNGKHRGDQLVPVNLTQEQAVAIARANAKVLPFVEGKNLLKVIYVPGRILNLVVAP
jgi:leucyl-tRNA synthetase